VIKYRANLTIKDAHHQTPLEWVEDKLDNEITDEERERFLSIQAYFKEFSKKRTQEEEKEVIKKWGEWFQRDTLFKIIYESRIKHDYLNYTMYNTLYTELKDVYQYMISEEYLIKKKLFISDIQQKDTVINQTMNKLMQAANHNAKEIDSLNKLFNFYEKLDQLNDGDATELLENEAASIFSTREAKERVFQLNKKGIKAQLFELTQTRDNLKYANAVLIEHKKFFEEAHKRIDDVVNFPERADFYKRIYAKNKDKVIRLRSNSITLSPTRKSESNSALFSSFSAPSESPRIPQKTLFARKSLDKPNVAKEEHNKEFDILLNNFD
jgi:hypothetical protein